MSSLPTSVAAVVSLFQSDLASVRFGDVDAAALAHATAAVDDASAVVAAARDALASAESTLAERQETALRLAHRALAYARVFSEADEALSGRLASIALPRPPRAAREVASVDASAPLTARRRGRPRKNDAAELPGLQAAPALGRESSAE